MGKFHSNYDRVVDRKEWRGIVPCQVSAPLHKHRNQTKMVEEGVQLEILLHISEEWLHHHEDH